MCAFDLILRGLDTIEDDTSIPLETKEPLLREFKDYWIKMVGPIRGKRPDEKAESRLESDRPIDKRRNKHSLCNHLLDSTTSRSESPLRYHDTPVEKRWIAETQLQRGESHTLRNSTEVVHTLLNAGQQDATSGR